AVTILHNGMVKIVEHVAMVAYRIDTGGVRRPNKKKKGTEKSDQTCHKRHPLVPGADMPIGAILTLF
ncbi:MAG: hypothetical protein DI626_11625, partial [Micavibrio aeruginosavorus]